VATIQTAGMLAGTYDAIAYLREHIVLTVIFCYMLRLG
jgi:hypothetical protein